MPTQAPNTTTGAEWRARYCSEFYDVQGRHWRVEFIDNDINTGHQDFTLSTTGCHEVEMTDDGFVLAEEDLKIRGPGDVLGKEQSGFTSEMRFVEYLADTNLIKQSRDVAEQFIANQRLE